MLLGEAPAGGNADRSVAARVLGASCSSTSTSTSDGSSLLARLQAQRAKNQQTSCTPFLKKRKVDYFADVSPPSFAVSTTAAADTNSTAPAPLPPTPSSSSKKARRKQSAAVTLNRFELAFVAALSGSDFEEQGASGLGPARAVELILQLRSNVSLAAAREKQKEIKRSNKKRTRMPDESLAGVKELLQSSAAAAEYRKSVYDKDCVGVLRGYLREKHPALVEVFDRYAGEADSSAPNQKTAEAVGRQRQARGPEFFDFDVQKLLNLLPQSREKTKTALRPLFAERYFRRALLSNAKGAVVVGGTTLDARPGETGEDLHSKARSEGPAPPPAAALQGDRILTATALMASQLQQGGGAGCRGGRSSAPSATSSSAMFSPGREQSKDFRVRDRLSEERYEPFSLRAPVFPLQLRKKQEDGEHWRCVVNFGSDGWVEVRKSLLERFDPSLKDTLAALHEKKGGGMKSMTHARSRTATTPGATKSEAKRRTTSCQRESFEKHAKNCANVFKSRRPLFDARGGKRSSGDKGGTPVDAEAGADQVSSSAKTGAYSRGLTTTTTTEQRPLLFYSESNRNMQEAPANGSGSHMLAPETALPIKGVDPDKRFLGVPIDLAADLIAEDTEDSISPLVGRNFLPKNQRRLLDGSSQVLLPPFAFQPNKNRFSGERETVAVQLQAGAEEVEPAAAVPPPGLYFGDRSTSVLEAEEEVERPPKYNPSGVKTRRHVRGKKEDAETREEEVVAGGMRSSPAAGELLQCANCRRSFNANSYKKHVLICENVFGKKKPGGKCSGAAGHLSTSCKKSGANSCE
eukprot:g18956.t1